MRALGWFEWSGQPNSGWFSNGSIPTARQVYLARQIRLNLFATGSFFFLQLLLFLGGVVGDTRSPPAIGLRAHHEAQLAA